MTYLALSKEFRICLHDYAESLKFRCPSPTAAATKEGGAPRYALNDPTEDLLCKIINTGEYCIDTVPSLEESMKKHIQPSLVDEVDFGGQIDAYVDMISYTMTILVGGLSDRMFPALKVN